MTSADDAAREARGLCAMGSAVITVACSIKSPVFSLCSTSGSLLFKLQLTRDVLH